MDTSSVLTEEQCIEVSINSFCNESIKSFQAQLQYMEGMCNRDDTTTKSNLLTTNYTLYENYSTCIPISVMSNTCYSALVYHNGVLVGKTIPQQLILLPCKTSGLNFDGVMVNSSMGEILPGDLEEVIHDTKLELQCQEGYIPANDGLEFPSIICCLNGTFQPVPMTNGTLCFPSTGDHLKVAYCTCMIVSIHAGILA